MFFEIIRFALTKEMPEDERQRCFEALRRLREIDVVLNVLIGDERAAGEFDGEAGQTAAGFTHCAIVTIPGDEFYGAYQRHDHRSSLVQQVLPRLRKCEIISVSVRDKTDPRPGGRPRLHSSGP